MAAGPVMRIGALVAGLLGCAIAASAQQLEPRAYSPSPVGTNFVLLPYTYQTGSVLTDPSLGLSHPVRK